MSKKVQKYLNDEKEGGDTARLLETEKGGKDKIKGGGFY